MGAKSAMTARRILVVLALALHGMLAGRDVTAQPAASLVLERTIPLKGVSGRIDHMAVDLARKRLFVVNLSTKNDERVIAICGELLNRIHRITERPCFRYQQAAAT